MTLAVDLLTEFDSDLEEGWGLVLDEYQLAVRTDPATPQDTGALLDGIEYKSRQAPNGGTAEAELVSSARTDQGADYGTILDKSTGRQVFAKDYGHRAFGPFRDGGFAASFRVTTKHVGWWDNANSVGNWADAMNQFASVDL